MKYLITGGCGFIGTNLVKDLLFSEKNSIRVFDNLSVGSRADLEAISAFTEINLADYSWGPKGSVQLIEGCIMDKNSLEKASEGADIIVHLAANTGVGPSVENPMTDCEINIIGTLNVLEAARKTNVSRFIFASSGAPLGEQIPPLHEDMVPRPTSPYGASKLAGEAYCSAYFQCFGLQTIALRFSNVYGIGSSKKQSLVAKFIKRSLKGLPLEIYGDGNQTRDFIYITDLISAIKRSVHQPDIGGEIFQIATSQETTVLEIANKLNKIMRSKGLNTSNIIHTALRNGDVLRNFSKTSKAHRLLGWEPLVTLENGLDKTINYFCKL